jgi:hypothetical protein
MTTHFHLVLRLRMRVAINTLLQYVFMAWYVVKHMDTLLYFTLIYFTFLYFTLREAEKNYEKISHDNWFTGQDPNQVPI